MPSVLPFDVLNEFKNGVLARFADGNISDMPRKKEEEEDIIDEMLDLYLLAYAQATEVTNDSLSSSWQPTLGDVMKVVDEEVAGKTWKERVEGYFADGGTGDDIVRIAETEAHRIANTAALEAAKKAGAKYKTWVTMLDDRVREQHSYLEGETVGIDEDFYTYDGDHGQAPGLFQTAENNVNCRCELLFS